MKIQLEITEYQFEQLIKCNKLHNKKTDYTQDLEQTLNNVFEIYLKVK